MAGWVSNSYEIAEGWFRNLKPKSRTGIDVWQRPLTFEALASKGTARTSKLRKSRRWKPSPACRQPLQATQYEGRPPFRILSVVQPQLRKAAQQSRDRDLRLDARKLGAEAKVNASAKRQRTDIGSGDIETFRPVGIDRWVAIGRAEQAEHAFTFRDFLAAEVIDIFQRHPAGQLHRGIVTQEFLDGVGDEGGIGLEQRELIGIAVQRQQAVADQIDGGLVPGAEQQNDIGGQLLIRELAAIFLRVHQLRGQVVTRVAPAPFEQLLEIHFGGDVSCVGFIDLGARPRHPIEQASATSRAGGGKLAMV